MEVPPIGAVARTLLAALMLAACSQTAPVQPSSRPDDKAAAERPTFGEFSDIPVPAKAEMDLERTLIFGARDEWIGRLALSTPHTANHMYDFYQREMPKFGWGEVTSVRAAVSVLTFARGSRVATIQIRGSRLRGSEIDLVVSPKEAQRR